MGRSQRPGTQQLPPAKAFRRSLRVRVVAACTEEETSPTEFAEREKMEPANAGVNAVPGSAEEGQHLKPGHFPIAGLKHREAGS